MSSELDYDPTDPEQWGDPEPASRRRSESRRLASMVSVRFTPEEADRVRAIAATAGLSLSGYLRRLALSPHTISLGQTATVTSLATLSVTSGHAT